MMEPETALKNLKAILEKQGVSPASIWQKADVSESGFLLVNELMNALLGAHLTETEKRALEHAFDIHGFGRIERDSFFSLLGYVEENAGVEQQVIANDSRNNQSQ